MTHLVPALLAGALVALSLGACQAQVAGTAAPTPGLTAAPTPGLTPAPGSAPSGASLSGKWVTGADAEPPAGPVTVKLDCAYGRYPAYHQPKEYNSTSWELVQTGDAVKLTSLSDPQVGPTGPQPGCPIKGTAGTGTYVGGRLQVTATFTADTQYCDKYPNPTPYPTPTTEAVTIDLTYDAASGHLRGTRNGKAYWAAPIKVEGPPPAAECQGQSFPVP